MTRLGIAVSGGLRASEIVDCIQLAEACGYESAWVAEGHGGDQFACLSAAAVKTSKIQLGTSISSVFARTIPTIAMAAATVDDISDGRFILGLGSSHKVQVTPEHGVPYGKPLTRVKESVAIIRTLVSQGQVQFQGETVNIENFDLWFTPHRSSFPIYLSAVFPKMTALCGEIADGVILTRSTLQTAAKVRSLLQEGAARSGRDANAVTISSLLPAAIADTSAAARELMRPGLAFYAGFFPRYNKLLADHGFVQEAETIAAAWVRGDREAAKAAVSDAVIDATSIAGTAEECRERIQAYRDSGIDLPILSPFARGPGAKDVFERVIKACAPQ